MIQDITEGEVEIGKIGKVGEDDAAKSRRTLRLSSWSTASLSRRQGRASTFIGTVAKKFRVRYRIDGVMHEQKGAEAVAGFHHQRLKFNRTCRLPSAAFRRTDASRRRLRQND